jgi:hypothetical protein
MHERGATGGSSGVHVPTGRPRYRTARRRRARTRQRRGRLWRVGCPHRVEAERVSVPGLLAVKECEERGDGLGEELIVLEHNRETS